MDRVDEACSKILYAKFQLGLFENRFVDTSKIGENVFIKSHLDKASNSMHAHKANRGKKSLPHLPLGRTPSFSWAVA